MIELQDAPGKSAASNQAGSRLADSGAARSGGSTVAVTKIDARDLPYDKFLKELCRFQQTCSYSKCGSWLGCS